MAMAFLQQVHKERAIRREGERARDGARTLSSVSFYKDTIPIGPGSTLTTSLNLNYFLSQIYFQIQPQCGVGVSTCDDVGLDPGVPGSHPEPKADAQPLSPLGVPSLDVPKAF